MQTNGTLLSQEWINLLLTLNVGVGISLDGPKEINDANRINHAGKGSYDQVNLAIDMILSDPRTEEMFGSVLSVINLDADPLEIYWHYKDMGLRGVDFLLPDGTYDNPPPGLSLEAIDTPYADWLISIFDAWFDEGDPSFRIRYFENIIDLIFGTKHTLDSLGKGKNSIAVIETNGSIEPVDVLKTCGHGFTKLGYNVLTHGIDDVFASDLMWLYLAGDEENLGKTCQTCLVLDICGGGYMPHRYSSINGFDNPSIYCRDLMKLIIHIHTKVVSTLPERLRRKLGLMPLPSEIINGSRLHR